MENSKIIGLIGMPGVGKTTVGTLLSQKLNLPFIDIDHEIVKSHGEITEIFAEFGETGFRKIETETIQKFLEPQNIESQSTIGQVISFGGGAVKHNGELIKNSTISFWIQRDLGKIMDTLDDKRPLSKSLSDLQKLAQERFPLYSKYSDFEVEISINAEDCVEKILKQLSAINYLK